MPDLKKQIHRSTEKPGIRTSLKIHWALQAGLSKGALQNFKKSNGAETFHTLSNLRQECVRAGIHKSRNFERLFSVMFIYILYFWFPD